jgi:signal transduction histidine kinase
MQMKTIHRKAIKIVLIYFVVGSLWILFTDRIIEYFVTDIHHLTEFQTFKGWFYILSTTLLLYLLIIAQLKKINSANRQLRESNLIISRLLSRLNYAQRTARIGSWDWDMGTNEVWWSDEMYSIFEADPFDYTPTIDSDKRFVHPDDLPDYQMVFKNALKTQKQLNFDFRIITSIGTTKECNIIGRTEYDRDGNTVRMTGTVMDISERKQTEKEIKKINEELEQRVLERTAQLESANHELKSFSYSVSHDLRAPLRAMDGFANMLLEDYETVLDTEGKRKLQIIISNANNMGNLIDNLLAFSLISGREMSFSAIDMNTVANQVCNDAANETGRDRTEFITKVLPQAFGDAAMIKQVWVNLIGNAVKFSSGKPAFKIEIGFDKLEDENVYYIKDNGVGFNMEYSGQMFNAFKRLHSSNDFEGTGIGLSIVQRIIHRHGGRIWAEGKVNEGATFYFTLPIRQ